MTTPATLPEPLVPAEVDLTDYSFMPLKVRRLLKSDTWIEAVGVPNLSHALICLWAESWYQVPAASLPDNDKILARLAMCDDETWRAIKERALRGWLKCSDGRLYHPTVAELAIEGWGRKKTASEKGKAGAKIRWSKNRAEAASDGTGNATAMAQAMPAPMPADGKGQGQGQGHRQVEEEAPSAPSATELDNKKATKREIVFKSGCIQLTAEHLDQWANAFSSYPDLRAELTAIAAKLQDEPPAGFKPEKWFGTVAAWLKKGHERNLREGKASPAAGDDAFAREATQWRARCKSHFERGKWQEQLWGPSPDSPGCMCPPAILAEFRKPNGRAAA
jgi:Protein of unknown function (DUF1376)